LKGLSDKDKLILTLINKAMPQGVNPTKIFLEFNLTAQNTNRYLNKLLKKGLITKRKEGIITNYFIAEAGINALSNQAVQPTTSVYPQALQRPHALQVNAFLFRTSWGRLEPTLTNLSLPYHKELKGNLIRFNWRGRELRATSQYLYTISELPPLPINVPIEQIKDKAMLEAGAYIELFLTATGLRCKRDRLGMLALEVRYYENGYVDNEIADKSLEDKTRIVYAYDKATGKVRAWADSSLGDIKELETNSDTVDNEMKAFLQAVENKEIQPYKDEIDTRKNMLETKEAINQISNNVLELAKQTNYLAKNFNAHIPYFEQAAKKDKIIIELAESLLPHSSKKTKQALEDLKQQRL
jgi:predicted transcriptional regulator